MVIIMKNSAKSLSIGALMIALAAVLSMVRLFRMPLGGSVTLASVAPLLLACYFLKPEFAFITATAYSLIQLITGLDNLKGLSLISTVGSLFFDYIIAYAVLGVIVFFGLKRKNIFTFAIGAVSVCVLRFICHLLSGMLFFAEWTPPEYANSFVYSFLYNGGFLLPDSLIAVVVAIALFIPFKMLSKEMDI